MATLVLQTVFPEIAILLLEQNGTLVDSNSWESQKDEVKKLIPEMEKLLSKNNLSWKNLEKIIVTVGVGAFSSTRIGVTIANTLAMATGAKLYEIELKEKIPIKKLLELVNSVKLKPVKIAKPVYRSSPMITPSKKKSFK